MKVMALNLSSGGLEFASARPGGGEWIKGMVPLRSFDESEARTVSERLAASLKGEPVDLLAASGGLDAPLNGGVYFLNDDLEGRLASAGAIGFAPLVALLTARLLGLRALLVEPMTSSELLPHGLITGLPELPVRPLRHAPQVKWCNMLAREEGLFPQDASSVVAYLGRGFSVCALKGDRVLDSNNPEETGPFSVAFSGSVPAMDLIREALSGRRSREELVRLLAGGGGVAGYLGTYLMTEVEASYQRGSQRAAEVVRAMAHQVSQSLWAMAGALDGAVDFIALCGGCAAFSDLSDLISRRVQWIAPVFRYPRITGLQAVSELALRSLDGRYTPPAEIGPL
ncbi:butyrate kinase [Thermanaerovibrio velox DSM 12556]|uniref:Butyrate kinase n=1 Tax=Thermanaerovibrio velox DSM 12556 TaxID=926567 RepID=H0UPU0_9BACT|nr:butyrate kinase [Thermanaerovibrio velox]EHM10649.1 butyrate kinase [Thermanaerovibrio velox DSM 12556]